MALFLAAIVAGFVALVWSADRFVHGAAGFARNFGVSPIVIGMTIVGFGTSAPEMLVSVMAAWGGNTPMAVGNAIGSNITNVALVLGLTAVLAPIRVNSGILRREFPVLLLIMVLAGVLLFDSELGWWDGAFLVLGLGGLVYWMLHIARQDRKGDPLAQEFEEEIPRTLSTGMALFWLVLGLGMLLVSSKLLVWGAVGIAQTLGVSDLVIGLTIVAVGTSLPELAASITSALKNEHEMAIGNVLGSNMFNLLAVLGLPGLIHPAVLDPAVMSRDFLIMAILTVVLLFMAYGFRGEGRISRLEGSLLVMAFAGYMVILYLTAM